MTVDLHSAPTIPRCRDIPNLQAGDKMRGDSWVGTGSAGSRTMPVWPVWRLLALDRSTSEVAERGVVVASEQHGFAGWYRKA